MRRNGDSSTQCLEASRNRRRLALAVLSFTLAPVALGAVEWAVPLEQVTEQLERSHRAACLALAERLGSVSLSDCTESGFDLSGGLSTLGLPLLVREYPPLPARTARGRVLLFGGIHGDELSSVSIVFRWVEILNEFHSGLFHWRIVPALNPDGLLQRPALRMNANGIDLNRNFPSPDWETEAPAYWIRRTSRNPRRYPGQSALSEPESRWLAEEIRTFQPDVIVSVHAPLEVLDFDGPPDPPRRLGSLWLNQLGTYPGSLGRWAGLHLGIPVVTIELPRAGILPAESERLAMWTDLVRWLKKRLPPRSGSQVAGG